MGAPQIIDSILKVAQVGPPQMINDPLLARAGTRYEADKPIKDPWVAEHPFANRPNFRGNDTVRGRGRGRGFSANVGDIAQRRKNYTLGIPDPQRPRDLTGIPEFDKPKVGLNFINFIKNF